MPEQCGNRSACRGQQVIAASFQQLLWSPLKQTFYTGDCTPHVQCMLHAFPQLLRCILQGGMCACMHVALHVKQQANTNHKMLPGSSEWLTQTDYNRQAHSRPLVLVRSGRSMQQCHAPNPTPWPNTLRDRHHSQCHNIYSKTGQDKETDKPLGL